MSTLSFIKPPIARPENVRIAIQRDEPELFKLLHRLHDDNPNPANLPIDDEKVWAHVNACCRGQRAIAGVVDAPDGSGLIASVGIFYTTAWWTSLGNLSQYWLFCDEPYRYGGKIYKDLIKFSRWHRADMSARLGYNIGLENSFITKQDPAKRARLWRKTGKCIGLMYWLED